MSRQPRLRSERGAIIIHVAFALMALLVFTSFIIDYGVMWVSRRQAQNVVDSAALAGALALHVWRRPDPGGAALRRRQSDLGSGQLGRERRGRFVGSRHDIPPCGLDARLRARGCVPQHAGPHDVHRAAMPFPLILRAL